MSGALPETLSASSGWQSQVLVQNDYTFAYNSAKMLLTRGSNSYTNDLNGDTLTGGGRTNTLNGQLAN